MKPLLSKTQPLKEIATGLWSSDGNSKEGFSFSDGEQFEKYLLKTLRSVSDLSSSSEELNVAGVDWPSTYHLSSKRNHIIAGLNLGKNRRIIEIGSGCGAITRYLADKGHTVDAIEGSLARATIARERCRNCPNVNIIVSNFNDLKLPEDTYDVALFIGVLEYAQRFSDSFSTPEQSVARMLKKTLKTIVPDGCIVVAIENRLGFKYAYGAGEDHYGKPYIGIAGYPVIPGTKTESRSDIATYSQDEWINIICTIKDLHSGFYYPFPDYKLADVLISEEFINTNNDASNLIRKTLSFDPTGKWQPPINEYTHWRYAAQVGSLGKTANSFGIVMARDPDSVKKMLDFDFICFSNQKRKKSLQTRVEKKRNSTQVERIKISNREKSHALFKFNPQPDHYRPGRLLLDYWADVLQSNPEPAALNHLVHEMFKKKTIFLNHENDEQFNLDLTILNILVDDEDDWYVFDREWFSSVPLTVELLMFRSLMYFACIYPERILFTKLMGWHTVFDFVDGCFALVDLDFPSSYIDLVSFENEFQQYALNSQHYIPAEVRLSQVFDTSIETTDLSTIHPRLYLADQSGKFTDARSKNRVIPLCTKPFHLIFSILEAKIEPGGLLRLRFDPTDENTARQKHLLKISEMAVSIRQGGKEKRLWSSNDAKDISNILKIQNMSLKKHQGGIYYQIKHPDPQMIFESRLPDDICPVGMIVFKVMLSFS